MHPYTSKLPERHKKQHPNKKQTNTRFDCLRDWVDVYISTKKLHCDIEYIVTAYKVGIINKVKWLFVLLECRYWTYKKNCGFFYLYGYQTKKIRFCNNGIFAGVFIDTLWITE